MGSLRTQASALFWIMRPLNSSVAGVAVVLALFIGMHTPLPLQVFIGAAFAAFFTTAHAMVHNDIVDVQIDTINAPQRPLPSKKISIRIAKLWAILLLLLAMLSGAYIDFYIEMWHFSVFWALGNAFILDSYNLYFKKTGLIGNFLVAYPPYALFLFADFVLNHSLTLELQSIGLEALFIIWGREVMKGIYDIPGDRAAGVQTIAVKYGRNVAAQVSAVIIFLSVVVGLPLVLLNLSNVIFVILLVLFNLILIFKSVLFIKNPSNENAFQTKLLIMRLLLLFLFLLVINEIVAKFF